ncbi:hypothetical protein L0F63_006249, partial [Massospora cicadina]
NFSTTVSPADATDSNRNNPQPNPVEPGLPREGTNLNQVRLPKVSQPTFGLTGWTSPPVKGSKRGLPPIVFNNRTPSLQDFLAAAQNQLTVTREGLRVAAHRVPYLVEGVGNSFPR